jgi:ligand-binding sensor domain-containing protein/two-component sensor histidine kinase
MRPILFLLGILWASPLFVLGQQFQYTFYTEKDGLSNKTVSSLLTDHQGFLWVATPFGLNRFDGNEFEQFYNDPADSNSIGDNNIQTLYQDREKRLWIGTNAGLSLYHPQTNRFSNYSPDSSVAPQQGISFGALCEDRSGNIWVGAKNELLIFHPSGDRFSPSGWNSYAESVAPANSNHGRVIVLGLTQKSPDEMWVLSTYGLFSVNTTTRAFRYYPYPPIGDFNGCQLFDTDSHGNVWIGTFVNSLLSLNPLSGKWTYFPAPPGFSLSDRSSGIVQYSRDSFLYPSLGALEEFGVLGKTHAALIPCERAAAEFFRDATLTALIRLSPMVWLGTDKGLAKIRPQENQFRFIPLTEKGTTGRVFPIPHSDEILFSSLKNGVYTTYRTRKGGSPSPVRLPNGDTLHCSYQYFAAGSKKEYYLNDDEHFYQYDPVANIATPLPFPPLPSPGTPVDVRNMVIDKEGKVWVRTLGQGILLYDPGQGTISVKREIPIRPNKEVNALWYDSLTHTIWAAEEFNGVYSYDIARNIARHYALSQPGSKRSASIVSIVGDGNGNIWLMDLQAGLVEFDHRNHAFNRYTVNDGLAANNGYWLARDPRGMIWINTDAGITRYDPATHLFVNFPRKEGFPGSMNVYLSAGNNGNIYFPHRNGYSFWNVADIRDPAKGGTLYIRDIQLFDRHLPTDHAYRFAAGENNIRFLFGLLSFDDRDRLKLEYKLNGNSWIVADLHSYISFANLAPGNYDLQVRIKNERIGNLHISFRVERPFWQSAWALAFLLLAITGTIILVNKVRLRRERKESALRQKIMESEMSALRSQMNPHFIFNTLNSINSYIIENKKDEASDYLGDFSKLIRLILDHSKKRTISLTEELYALKLYLELESRRLDSFFDYTITTGPDLDPDSITLPPLVIQPFVENAIWHGLRGRKSGGSISIHIDPHKGGLLVLVEDDGIGRAAAKKLEKRKEGNSFGTAATTQRILLNDPSSSVIMEDLYDEKGMAAGTRVYIYVNQNSQ